jgi:hypothetical protein
MMHALATVKRLTGKTIRLGMFEEVGNSTITDERIVVLVHRAKVKESRGGFIITHRGSTLYEFTCNSLGAWIMGKPLTVWNETEEWHTAFPGLTPAENAARLEWEELCYRPGTDSFPMDNADRKRQGYTKS